MKLPFHVIYGWLRKQITNPKYRWWIVAGTLVYLLNPFDVSPDFIPFLGQVDDALLVTLVATEISQHLLNHVKTIKHQQKAA